MGHIKLKPTIEYKIDFHPSELDKTPVPEESKKMAMDYLDSNKLSDEDNNDILIMFEDKVIYGYDYLYNNKKLIMPEINPVTIFFSNAVMSHGHLSYYREILLSKSADVRNVGQFISLGHFGDFFKLAFNCIINLQASLETYLNSKIPITYKFYNEKGKLKQGSIHEKIDIALKEITKRSYDKEDDIKLIKELIFLRNRMIHLKPVNDITNTKYKNLYRTILDFKYFKAIIAVRNFLNYYEPNLIEECTCGNNFYYSISDKAI